MLDTNILVSALLKPESIPARLLNLVVADQLVLLVDERILSEYSEVLKRKKFGFDHDLVEEMISYFHQKAEWITAIPLSLKIPDPDDLPFIEVAAIGKADALITGNVKDYGTPPKEVKIYTPSQFLTYFSKTRLSPFATLT